MARALPPPHNHQRGAVIILIQLHDNGAIASVQHARRIINVGAERTGDDRRAALISLRDELVAEFGDGADPAGVMPRNGELPDGRDRQFLKAVAAHHVAHSDGAVRTASLDYLRTTRDGT